MKLTFEINEAKTAIVTKDAYGFILTIRTPPVDAERNKKGYTKVEYFYPNLSTIARKVAYLGLEGDDIGRVVESMDETAVRVAETLIKGWEGS